MSKTTLNSIINTAIKEHDSFQADMLHIKESQHLNDDGKAYELDRLKRGYQDIFNKIADRAEVEIDSAINRLKNTRKKNVTSKLTDAGYQIGLKNAVDMLKTGSVRIDDAISIINTYKNDAGALALLKSAINEMPNKDDSLRLTSIISEDNIDRNIEFLEKLKESMSDRIRKLEGGNAYNILLMGYTDTLDQKLDDNYCLK